MSDPEKRGSSRLIDNADVTLAELHNVISTQQATRVRDLSSKQFSAASECGCCRMPSVSLTIGCPSFLALLQDY